ncbi:hypothetical protein [Desulfitobacterium metallireducens]|uniref:Uncharacterized protein n=1 Tax=Desulfitobacterium metallireducens DSM 15288 TaxID=871968 RepID=W0EHR9_9FIRM|nr:hypothetical protein [Desulfitobacterium metallireducens]AHF08621.1 hypothetical protein DESME_09975 [Desulfitobacterium metallireducens DSM 15288]
MFFLNKLSSRTNEQKQELELAPAPSPSTSSLEQENSPEVLENANTELDQDFSYETPALFSKFLRNQKIYSGPDTFFEDESWAPEYQSVRLFHRQWGTTEEQISSPSDPQ